MTTSSRELAAFATSPRRWWALVVLAFGLALIVLDGTIVGVSMPTIIRELNLDLAGAQWVTSLYAVVFAALLLTAGRLGDRFGRRTLFLNGLVVFTAGSVAAALSTSAATLILARVVQGLGGAAILPSTLSTVNAVFRGKDRATAFGVWGAVMAGAAAVGPLAGGLLTQYAGWQWIFWVNVPLGAILVAGALVVVPNTSATSVLDEETGGASAGESGGFDVAGFVLSALGFGALVFGIIEGPEVGFCEQLTPFTAGSLTWPEAWPAAPGVALVVAAIALAAFVAVELGRARRAETLLLDLSMFRFPMFSWGNLTALMVAIGEFAVIFVLPLYLVSAVGLSTLAIGGVLTAMALGAFFSGAMARHLAERISPSGVVLLGLGLEVLGALQLASEERIGQPVWLIVAALLLYGLGLGLASAQLTSLVLGDIPVSQSGQASATQSTVRQIGSALGAALAGAVLSAGLAWKTTDLSGPAAQFTGPLRDSAGAILVGLREQGLPDTVVSPLAAAFAEATKLSLYASVACLFVGLLAAFMVRRSATAASAPTAATPDTAPAPSEPARS